MAFQTTSTECLTSASIWVTVSLSDTQPSVWTPSELASTSKIPWTTFIWSRDCKMNPRKPSSSRSLVELIRTASVKRKLTQYLFITPKQHKKNTTSSLQVSRTNMSRTFCPQRITFYPQRDYVTFGYLPSQFHLSVVCRLTRLSVVRNVRALYSADWNFRQCLYAILYTSHPLTSVQKFTEIVQGNPSVGVKRKRGEQI